LLVEQDCEPTQSLCPCDHAIIYTYIYFPNTLSWQPLLFQNYFICPKQEAIFIFETKPLAKLSIYKTTGT
jgi:hypothetical protein